MTKQVKPRPAYVLALCALMTALGTALILASGLIPLMTFSAPFLATLVLVPIIAELGRKYGWMTWFATAVLSVILCVDKEAAFFYLFFGYYPIIKPYFDRIHPKALRILVKTLYAAGAIFAMYWLLLFVIKTDVDFSLEQKGLVILLFALMIAVFLDFDKGILAMEGVYHERIRGKLRFLG